MLRTDWVKAQLNQKNATSAEKEKTKRRKQKTLNIRTYVIELSAYQKNGG